MSCPLQNLTQKLFPYFFKGHSNNLVNTSFTLQFAGFHQQISEAFQISLSLWYSAVWKTDPGDVKLNKHEYLRYLTQEYI